MKIGAAVAFLNFNLRGANLLHTFNLGGSKVVLFEDYCMDAAESIVNDISPDTKLICYGFKAASPEGPFVGRDFKGIDAAALASEFPDGQLDPGLELRKSIRLNTITATYFTSGTTGLPKAAIQRHSRLSTFPATISLGLGYLGTKDRILCELPLYHGSAQISLNICCITGATYIFTRKFSASNFWKEAIRTRATAMHHIGEAARYILAVPPSPLDRAHGVTKAIGNGLRADVWEPLMTRFGIKEVFEWYGASEGSTAFFHVQSGRDGIGKIGRMGYLARRVGNAKLFKVDPVTEELVRDPKTGLCIECAFNEPGEVLGKIVPPELSPVKASSFDGYYNDPKATEKKIRRDVVVKGDSWMAMGDLLSMDRRGWLSELDGWSDRVIFM